MKVVHITNTPVAGSPGNIVSALNRLTDIQARHVVFNSSAYRTRTFPIDVDWKTQSAEALELVAEADVIHIHQHFSLEHTYGPDFLEKFGKKKIIKQYHSAPDLFGRRDPALMQSIINEPVPQLVIAQGPERYYPFARVVPNVIPMNDPRYLPCATPDADAENAPPIITFSPSGPSSAWKTRWETKGVPQTLKLLHKLERKGLCRLQLIVDTPHDACLRAKQKTAIAIDECVTGNYHLSGLEALSQGKPTLGHLDNRVQSQLRAMTGALELPWIDVRLEEAEGPLTELLQNRSLRAELGAASRAWIETYYQEAAMIAHYRRAYLDLFEAPERFHVRRFTQQSDPWLAVALPNHRWAARKRAHSPWRTLVDAVRGRDATRLGR